MGKIRAFSLISIVMVSTASIGLGQEQTADREILVMFQPGVIVLPEGITQAPIPEVTINVPAVRDVLERGNADSVIRAFPDFDQSDTLGISRTGEEVRLTDWSNLYRIRLSEGRGLVQIVSDLSAMREVLYAEPNGGAILNSVYPNDPHFDDPNNPGQEGHQWNLLNTTTGADIDATEAWDMTKGSGSTKIAFIDDGVWSSHEDLSGKVSGDAGYATHHGTHVAGIAAALTDNSKGIAGVDWNAVIESQRIDQAGLDDAVRVNAIMDALNNGSDIINDTQTLCDPCEWTLETIPTPRYSLTYRLAYSDAYKLNAVAVTVMGNFNTSETYYPAGFGQGIIAVGATTKSDIRWDEDPTLGSNTGGHIDVAAPGKDILSTVTYNKPAYNGDYDVKSGTSPATAHVSGLAGLLVAKNSNLYNDDIEQIVRISADDVNSGTLPGWDQYLGTGRVNARRALGFLGSSYALQQLSASGGADQGASSPYLMTIYGASGLSDGDYFVKRHEVRKAVGFSSTFNPRVWGRGVATTGWSDENPNFTMGWTDVVPGTVTSTSATLRTYAYEVLDCPTGNPFHCLSGGVEWDLVGWFPTDPSNLTLAFTVLGIQTVPVPQNISVVPSGGHPHVAWNPVSVDEMDLVGYHVYRKIGSGSWTRLTSSPQSSTTYTDFTIAVSNKFQGEWVKYRVTSIIKNTGTLPDAESDPSVAKGIWGKPLWKELADVEVLPQVFALHGNFPNPFNPVTTIRYDVPENSAVELRVYDLMGREISALVNGNVRAGYQNLIWDGKDSHGNPVSSGMYVYRIDVESLESDTQFHSTRKMVLLR